MLVVTFFGSPKYLPNLQPKQTELHDLTELEPYIHMYDTSSRLLGAKFAWQAHTLLSHSIEVKIYSKFQKLQSNIFS